MKQKLPIGTKYLHNIRRDKSFPLHAATLPSDFLWHKLHHQELTLILSLQQRDTLDLREMQIDA